MSFFDSANLGDLLISRALLDFATEFGPAERLSYSGDPFRFPDPDALPVGAGGPNGPASMRERLASTRVGHAAWRLKEAHTERHLRIGQTLARAQLVLLGGGNMIFDVDAWTRAADRFGYFVATARRSGTPTFGISLGIGPFATTRQHRDACKVLDRCERLTFRDRSSLRLYLEHGHRPADLGVDPVLLMGQVCDRPTTPSSRVAWNLVEPRLPRGMDDARRLTILHGHASVIKGLVSDGCTIELFSTDRADEPFLAELEALVGSSSCRVTAVTGITSLLALYREVDLVVASRMHALIVAFTQGVPVVGLSWQEKVRGFFDLVDRPGQCLDFRDLDPERLRSLVDEARRNPDGFACHQADRERLHGLNAANLKVMDEFDLAHL